MAREGLEESQFRRGDIHCGTLYKYVLCGAGAATHPIVTDLGSLSLGQREASSPLLRARPSKQLGGGGGGGREPNWPEPMDNFI